MTTGCVDSPPIEDIPSSTKPKENSHASLDAGRLRGLDRVGAAQAIWNINKPGAADEMPDSHADAMDAWGTLLALNADLQYDKSLFFSACMLHDLGLTPHAATPSDQCFTLRSSRASSDILRSAGASEAQVHCVAQAITLHLNLEVGVAQGVEAHLVQAGAGLDVVGQRSHEVPELLRHAIVEKHPRLGFKNHFCNCMRIESRSTPPSRTGLYVRRLGFLDLIGQVPFDE